MDSGPPDASGVAGGRTLLRRPTFRRRLTTAILVLVLAVVATASLSIFFVARHMLRRNVDDALLAIARTEVASSLDAPGGRVHVHEEGLAPIHVKQGNGYVKLAVIKRGGAIVAQTANLASGPALRTDPIKEAHALAGEPSFGSLHRGDEVYRGIYYPLHDATGEPMVAVVAVPLAPAQRALDTLRSVLIAVLAIAGVSSAWAASRVARRLTKPLEHIADAAHAISALDLQARIPDASPDAELREVTAILNVMLARLQATIEAQRRFVADASHELRSPLANLRGTVEVALRRPRSPDEYAASLRSALIEIERLCRLVDDLLTLSRADAGQMMLQPRRCDLGELAEAAVRAYAARADTVGVRLTCARDGALEVDADADRIRAAVDNLLDNALRHAPRASSIHVRAARAGDSGLLSVHDDGPGVDPADQARIFDRFYRTDAARDRNRGGLGLGLAIAKSIIDAHRGVLRVDSTAAHGTTFTIELPLARPL